MNATQRKHALERIGQIARKKRDRLNEAHRAALYPSLPGAALAVALRQGVVTVKAEFLKKDIKAGTNLMEVLETGLIPDSTRALADLNASLAAVNTEEQRLKDEIMLGDAQEALASIRAFEAL